MVKILIGLMLLMSAANSLVCPEKNKKEYIFMSQNETKVIQLESEYRSYNQKIIVSNDTNINSEIGRLTKNQLLLLDHQKVQVYKKFATIVDQAILQEKSGFSPHQYFVVLGSYNEDDYQLKVFKIPRFPESKETMSMQYELEVFDQSSPFSQGTLRRCFSVAYLDQKRIVVDCAIETTPMIFENVFVVINLKEIVFREYLTNVNIGQQNNIMKRKIGIVNHSQKDADDDDKTLIRAHLEVDGDHQNYTYLEVFSIDVDEDQSSMIQLVEVIDEKLATRNNLWHGEMKVLDFALTDYDLVVMVKNAILVFPFIHNQTLMEYAVYGTPQLSNKVYAFDDNNDQLQIVVPDKNKIAMIHGQIKFFNYHNVSNDTVLKSLAVLDDYLLAISDTQVFVVELRDFTIHSSIKKDDSPLYSGFFDDSCITFGTGVRNQFLVSCREFVQKGDIEIEALILEPKQHVESSPVVVQVIGEDALSQEIQCQLEILIDFGSGNSKQLTPGMELDVNLTKISSSDVFRSNELTYLRYEEFVDGPDVTLVSATVNGSKDYLSEIDFKSYELSSFNLTLKDSTILAMVKIDQLQITVFTQKKNQITAQNCKVIMDDDTTIRKITCSPESTPITVSGEVSEFQAVYDAPTQRTIVGFRCDDSNFLYMMYLRRFEKIQLTPHLELNGTFTMQFDNHTLILYTEKMGELRIYQLKVDRVAMQAKYEYLTSLKQEEVFNIFGISEPTNWCISLDQNKIFVSSIYGVMLLEKDEDIWQLTDYLIVAYYPQIYKCVARWGQLFLQHQNISIFGLDQQLYYRGNYGSFETNFQNFFASRDSLYFWDSGSKIFQYSAFQDESLVTALQRVIDTQAQSLIAVSLGNSDLVYVKKSSGSELIYALASEKKLLLNLTNFRGDRYFSTVKMEFDFRNSFGQRVSLQSNQPVSGQPKLVAIEDAKTPSLKARVPTSVYQPEVFFDISELFLGPINNITIDNNINYTLVNKAHLVQDVRNDDMVDFVHFLDGNVTKALVLTSNSVQVTSSNLTQKEMEIKLTLDSTSSCKRIWSENDMVVIEYGNSIGRRIYFGNLTAGCCNLTFENVTIRSYPSYTIPVKSLFRGNHYYSLFNENSRFVMSVYDVVNRVGTEYSLKEGSMYSDFDISSDEAILLLEEKQGIHILSQKGRRHLVQETDVTEKISLRDALVSAGEMVFTDSVFHGIKVSNGNIYVTTNNALTYRFSLNLMQKSVDFVQSYTRLGSLLLDRKSLWASDDFLVLGYNRVGAGKSLAFYNTSNSDFFQVIDVDRDVIEGQTIKIIESNYNQQSEQTSSAWSEMVNWPLQRGFVIRKEDSDLFSLGQVSPMVGVEINQKSHTDNKEIVVVTASNAEEQKKLLLEINLHWTNSDEEKTEETHTQNGSSSMNKLIDSPLIGGIVYGFAVFVVILVLIFVYRQLRRCCVKKETTHDDDEPHEFNDIP